MFKYLFNKYLCKKHHRNIDSMLVMGFYFLILRVNIYETIFNGNN